MGNVRYLDKYRPSNEIGNTFIVRVTDPNVIDVEAIILSVENLVSDTLVSVIPPPTDDVLRLDDLDPVDSDMIRMGIASKASFGKLTFLRDRVGKIEGTDYMFHLIDRILDEGKGFLPVSQRSDMPLPFQYRHHISLMNKDNSEFFLSFINACIHSRNARNYRLRRDLFFLRNEVIRHINSSGDISR